ncbi:MAG TPA: flagellar export protein FliJ [Vicinamibacterales bacterium]
MGKSFTFRAQPALDLRRREHDARRRSLVTAEFELTVERRRFDEACDTLCSARGDLGRQMEGRHASMDLTWHRDWIQRLEQSRSAHASAVAEKGARVAAAMAECVVARQRLESLERLKDKARRSWDDAERAREQREFDALATMRYEIAGREPAMRSTP